MSEGDDLACAAHPGTRHRRDDAGVQQVGQPLAQPGGHAGVAGQERAQPDRDDSPARRPRPARAGRRWPGPAAGCAGARAARGPVRRDAAQRAHTGVHPVHRTAAAPAPPVPHGTAGQPPSSSAGAELDPLPGRGPPDQPGVQITGRRDHDGRPWPGLRPPAWSPVAQHRADTGLLGPAQDQRADGDVQDGQARGARTGCARRDVPAPGDGRRRSGPARRAGTRPTAGRCPRAAAARRTGRTAPPASRRRRPCPSRRAGQARPR